MASCATYRTQRLQVHAQEDPQATVADLEHLPKTVLTLDRVPTKRGGIVHRCLPEWLLGR